MVLRQIFCRFTGSAAQTHCAQRPQFVSKKFLEEEIFAGTNFRELAFDRAKIAKISASRKFPAMRYTPNFAPLSRFCLNLKEVFTDYCNLTEVSS